MLHLAMNSGTKAFSSLISSVGLSILHQRLKAHSILITNLLKYNSLLHRSIWSQPVSFSTIHFFEEPNPPKPIMAAMSGSTSSGSCWAACSLWNHCIKSNYEIYFSQPTTSNCNFHFKKKAEISNRLSACMHLAALTFFSFFFSLRCRFLSSSSCCCFIILSSKSENIEKSKGMILLVISYKVIPNKDFIPKSAMGWNWHHIIWEIFFSHLVQ